MRFIPLAWTAFLVAALVPGLLRALPFELPDEASPTSSSAVHELLEKLPLELTLEDGQVIGELTGRMPGKIQAPKFWGREDRFAWARLVAMPIPEIEAVVLADESRPTALMILVDGLGGKYTDKFLHDENFRRAFQAPDLPHLRKHFFEEGRVVDTSVSSTPTISTRNIAILSSGLAPGDAGEGNGHSNIPNFTYLDRATGEWFYFWGTDGFSLNSIFKQVGRTVFQVLDSRETFAFGAIFSEGADAYYSPYIGEVLRKLRRGFQERRALARLKVRATREVALGVERRRILERVGEWRRGADDPEHLEEVIRTEAYETLNARHEGLPDLVFWYNPWIDHESHLHGAYSKEVLRDVMPELDEHLGQLFSVYDDPGMPAAVRENLLTVLVSDHGHTVIARNFSIEEVFTRNGIDFDKLSVDEGAFPVWHVRQKRSLVGKDMVIGSTAGGSFVIDLFHAKAYAPVDDMGRFDPGKLVDPALWMVHPTVSDCRAYRLFDGRQVDLIQMLTQDLIGLTPRGEVENILDFIALRDDGHTREQPRIRLLSPDGDARVERRRGAGGRWVYRYEVLSGEDPLGLAGGGGPAAELIASGGWHTDEDWLAASASTPRPDAIHELAHLYDLETAGTINLFPRAGWSTSSTVPGRHAGELFEEKNSIQLYGGPVARGPSHLPVARGGSAPVTILHHLLGSEFDASRFDYPSLLPHLKQPSTTD